MLEVNFGFYVEKVAGVTIEDASKKDRMEVQEETKKEEKADSSECKAMEREKQMKERLLENVTKIYGLEQVSELLVTQLNACLTKLEPLFQIEEQSKVTRLALYDFLIALINLEDEDILEAFSEKSYVKVALVTYLNFRMNSLLPSPRVCSS